MKNFKYTALDEKGEEKTGTIEALTQKEAVKKVRELGLFPVKIKQTKDSAGERMTPLDEETNKIEEEMRATDNTDDVPPPDLGEDENQETPDEPELDINVLLTEVMKLCKKYEPLLQKVMNDGAVKIAHKLADYKSKPTQMIEEQQATNRKLDVQNALLQNINDSLLELLKTQMEANSKT